jgi:hypothetical protein
MSVSLTQLILREKEINVECGHKYRKVFLYFLDLNTIKKTLIKPDFIFFLIFSSYISNKFYLLLSRFWL